MSKTLTDLPLDQDERNRYLQLIANQTTNMRRLVEDLADPRPAGLTRCRRSARTDVAQIAQDALSDAEALSSGAHTFEASIAPAEVWQQQ